MGNFSNTLVNHPQPQDHFSMKKFTVFLVGTIISYGKLSLVFWSLKKNDRALFEKMAFLDFALRAP